MAISNRPLSSSLDLWKTRFDQLRQSQKTVTEFCQFIGCSSATFYRWKQKVEREIGATAISNSGRQGHSALAGQSASVGPASRAVRSGAASRASTWATASRPSRVGSVKHSEASAFVPVVVGGAGQSWIRVRLKNGTRIEVPADALAALGVVLMNADRVVSAEHKVVA